MKLHNVHIGEVKTAKNGDSLKAILGSCVGIGLIWKARQLCGLAHCLLPENPAPSHMIGGRYVDQAVPSLLALMKIRQNDLDEVQAVIAGGGNMTNPNSPDSSKLVGAHNFSTAEREIRKRGIRLIHSECGGDEGRRITLKTSDCSFQIESIPRLNTGN